MNWTGGSLRRSKNANKGDIQKQKAHFARARTQLQNGTSNVAMSFRPSYLADTERCRVVSSLATEPRASIAASPRSAKGRTFAPSPNPEQSTRKRTHAQRDPETRLLETKYNRRFSQQEWIDIGPSQPLSIRFSSSKEKGLFGKRRKLNIGEAATNQLQLLQRSDGRTPYPHTSRIMRKSSEDITIHIGTTLLMDNCSSRSRDPLRSQPSSDPMLFEHGDVYAAYSESNQRTRSTSKNRQVFVASTKRAVPHTQQNGHDEAQKSPHYPAQDPSPRHRDRPSVIAEHIENGACQEQPDGVISGCHIIHNVDNSKGPLHLVFDERLTDTRSHMAWQSDSVVGEREHVLDVANARLSELGYAAHQVGTLHEQLNGIVDDEPGHEIVAAVDELSSSSMRPPDRPRNLLLSQPETLRIETPEANSNDWSQYPNFDVDIGSGSASTTGSASLPSLG